MKKFHLTFMALLLALTISAQSKINPEGLSMIDRYRDAIEAAADGTLPSRLSGDARPTEALPVVCAIVSLDGDRAVKSLEEAGAEIVRVRGDRAIVRFRIDDAERLAQLDAVKSISFGAKKTSKMDKARAAMGIDALQEGTGFEHTFNGEGVVVGMMDQGVDPNHLAFTDADGNNRVSRLWTIMGVDAIETLYDTPERIAGFTTDDPGDSHGTHVAGIMAGSYDRAGRCRIDQINNAGVETVATKSRIQFRGIATGADLALACGEFYDANILLAIENIIDYAEQRGLPAVINLSLGSNIGAHDGSDEFEGYLSDLGKDAVICIASGNEGDTNISLTKQLTAGDDRIMTFLLPASGKPGEAIGVFEAWASDATALEGAFVVYDNSTSDIVYRRDFSGNSGLATVSRSSDQLLDKAWVNGSNVKIRYSINQANHRYHLYAETAVGQADTRYVPGFILKGTPGQSVECFVNGMELYSNSVAGWDNGSGENSANTMCTADNIISVGAWTTKNRYYTATGSGTYSTANVVNELCGFSSYGRQMITGKEIPDICAPGAAIISAYSSYYVNEMLSSGKLDNANNLCGKAPATNPVSYWHSMQGTSMATPAVTGTVALMLQADPTLGVDEVRDILRSTADDPASVYDRLRWGAGKINALAAVKEVLKRQSGISEVVADDESALVVRDLGGKQFNIFMAGERSINVSLTAMSGATVIAVAGNGNDMTLDASAVAPGVYVLAVDGANSRVTRKIVIR